MSTQAALKALHAAPEVPAFSWEALLCTRLVEISSPHATGSTSLTAHVLLQAQREGEICAWIQPQHGPLYPPDLAATGIDLQALSVIQVPAGAGPWAAPKAAEILLRSGAFGLVIVDLRKHLPPGPPAWQGRLLGLARQHRAAVVLLTHKAAHAESLGAWISWRLQPQCQALGERMFLLAPQILKNKMGGVWPSHPLQCRGPWGIW